MTVLKSSFLLDFAGPTHLSLLMALVGRQERHPAFQYVKYCFNNSCKFAKGIQPAYLHVTPEKTGRLFNKNQKQQQQ